MNDTTTQSHAFGSLLLRTLVAAAGVGTAIAGLLTLAVFALAVIQSAA